MPDPILGVVETSHRLAVEMIVGRDERPDHRQLIPHAGLQREVFTNLHARNIRLNRLEFAANLGWRFRLEVVHVEVRRAAPQPYHDARLGWRGGGRQRTPPQEIDQRQTGPESTNLEEIAPTDAVAIFA